MKASIKLAGLFVVALAISTTMHAQENPVQLGIGYNFNMPLGSFKNFIGNTSYRGFNGELLIPVSKQLSIGLNASYNDFYQQYPRQVYDDTKGSTISAVVSNSVQTMPLVIKASYSFVKEGAIRPYISAGGGVNFITYNQYVGEFTNDSRNFIKPTVMGDAGVLIPFGKYSSGGFKLGATYNYTPLSYGDVDNVNNWGVHAGFVIGLH